MWTPDSIDTFDKLFTIQDVFTVASHIGNKYIAWDTHRCHDSILHFGLNAQIWKIEKINSIFSHVSQVWAGVSVHSGLFSKYLFHPETFRAQRVA